MPCYDGQCDSNYSNEESLRKEVEALLCVTLKYIESLDSKQIEDMCNHTDWVEAGVTESQLLSWWKSHKQQDTIRRKREREAKKKEEERNKVLKKLTHYERELLGIS